MTYDIFLMVLATLAVITSLVTNKVKEVLDNKKVKYASNIVVLVVAIVVGGVGTSVFYLWNNYEWTTLNIICIFLMCVANWLAAMFGYDKTKQTIEQVREIFLQLAAEPDVKPEEELKEVGTEEAPLEKEQE